jgi:hypothetical protein
MEQSYGFYWPPTGKPYFVDPKGKKIKLNAEGYIPYLVDKINEFEGEDNAAPSVSTSVSSSSKGKPSDNVVDQTTDAVAKSTSETTQPKEQTAEPTLSDGSKNQIKIASSIQHLMTHYPKNHYCVACSRAKLRATPSMKAPEGKVKTYKEFVDHVTVDLKTMFQDKKHWGNDGQKCMMVIYDSATESIGAYPMIEKTTEQIVAAYLDFKGN